jgi:septal ring factor EnvC (AmiA/AmiB activator)
MSEEGLKRAKSGAEAIKSMLVVATTVIALFGSVFAGYLHIDTKYALAADVEKIEKRLSLSELRDSLRLSLDELYFLKSQIRKYPNDEEIKDQLKEIKVEVKDLKDQIKARTKKVNE